MGVTNQESPCDLSSRSIKNTKKSNALAQANLALMLFLHEGLDLRLMVALRINGAGLG